MKRLSFEFLIGFPIILVITFFLFSETQAKQVVLPDSVKRIFYKEKKLERRFELIIDQASNELNTSLSSSMALYGIFFADSLKDKRMLARAHEVYGMSLNKKGDYISGIENLGQALQLFEQLKSFEDVAKVKRTMGETFRASKNYELAMSYLNQSLIYFSNNPDPVMLARIYNRIAATLLEMWYIKDGSLFGSFISSNPSISYGAKLALEPDLKVKDDSLVNTIQASKYHASNAKRYDLIISTNIIEGSYLVSTKQFEKAVALFEETVQLLEREELYEDLPLVYLNWSRVYSIGNLEEPEKAIELSKKALEIAIEQDVPVYIFMANDIIHSNYASIGDYQSAYNFLLEQVPLIQEYGEKDLLTQLKTLEFQYNLQESKRELLNKKVQMRIILSGITIVVLFTSVFIYFLTQNNKKQVELLSDLSEKNKIISEQNKALEQTNGEKDRFFAILAHDLKGPVKSVSASLDLINEDLKNGNTESALLMTATVSGAARRASDLLSNLIEWAKSQRGKVHVNPQPLDLTREIQKNLQLFEENLKNKQLLVTNELENPIHITTDKDILDTVVRNILSNAIKFSVAGGTIHIQAIQEDEKLILIIIDEGIGMNQEVLQNIFKIDAKNSRPGTAGEVSSGLGLILCKDFLAYINGEIKIESEENKGTKVSIILPLHT
ncbi:ATP-binding protein [Mongoliitalea daihaiensis]|uniref:ATP-binding protein n=1 Tax=Mongoliitalea daihaiensis TaxID=2782006 RepID=UPI001F38A01E|nr:tetratricopeptide repeat-containing sensor histidine kinase [Mongoliitalea daihaiensis]UJP64075.1 tetratricopeptide repeat-containing sensor histidine kinase [Mongoliitalea daihaiensis]